MKNFGNKSLKKSLVTALIVMSSLMQQRTLMPMKKNRSDPDASLYAIFTNSLKPQTGPRANPSPQEESYSDSDDALVSDESYDELDSIDKQIQQFKKSLQDDEVALIYDYIRDNQWLDTIFKNDLHRSTLWSIVPSPDDTEKQYVYRKKIAKILIQNHRTWDQVETIAILTLLLNIPCVKILFADDALEQEHQTIKYWQSLNNLFNALNTYDQDSLPSSCSSDDSNNGCSEDSDDSFYSTSSQESDSSINFEEQLLKDICSYLTFSEIYFTHILNNNLFSALMLITKKRLHDTDEILTYKDKLTQFIWCNPLQTYEQMDEPLTIKNLFDNHEYARWLKQRGLRTTEITLMQKTLEKSEYQSWLFSCIHTKNFQNVMSVVD